jgi:hypothetical protein
MIYQSSLTPGTSIHGLGVGDIIGTLAGEYIDAPDVLHYLKAVDLALTTGESHCSFHINGQRIFALMTRISSMRVKVREWVIHEFDDLVGILLEEV